MLLYYLVNIIIPWQWTNRNNQFDTNTSSTTFAFLVAHFTTLWLLRLHNHFTKHLSSLHSLVANPIHSLLHHLLASQYFPTSLHLVVQHLFVKVLPTCNHHMELHLCPNREISQNSPSCPVVHKVWKEMWKEWELLLIWHVPWLIMRMLSWTWEIV